jgi:gliding motility-associated-like protein
MKTIFTRSFFLAFFIIAKLQVFSHNEHNTLSFIENKGQWESNLLYQAKIGGGVIWLENTAFTYSFYNQEDLEKFHDQHHGTNGGTEQILVRSHGYKQTFIGANLYTHTKGIHKKSAYHNYFLGNDANKWVSNVPLFEQVLYENIYRGINLRIHSNHEGYLKYDFIVSPGTNADIIKWKYIGITPEVVNGEIHLNTHAGLVTEKHPIAWQIINGNKQFVPCAYKISNGEISFNFPKGYNQLYELIIDPTLIFSTYSGSTADNWGFTATYDYQGFLYAGGIAFSNGYPTMGAYQANFAGGAVDVSISKFTTTGNALVFSTYLGGNGADVPHSLVCDLNNNLYVYGTTSSNNFPVTAGCYDNTFNGGTATTVNGINYASGSDIFVSKFNLAGNNLLGSTYVGGSGNDGLNSAGTLNFNYADQNRGEIFVDANNDVYVASSTRSNNFPVTPGSLSTALSGTQDGCSFRLNSGFNNLVWSTYIGGSNDDAAYSVKISNNNKVFICGGTRSTNFHNIGNGLINTAPGGVSDGYVIALNQSNGSLLHATYLGTNLYDQCYILDLDFDDDVYVVGQTRGAYPVTMGVYSNPNSSQFIHKLNNNLNTTGFSTVFGSGNASITNISPTAFMVDFCKNIYVSGWGGTINTSAGGNTNNMPLTSDAYDNTTDGSDFYFMVLERNAQSLLYGTYFGGNIAEHVDGGTSRFDKNGTIYQAVCAGCGGSQNFPTTPGVWSNTNNSTNCNIGSIKMEFNYQGVQAGANASPNIIACDPPFVVNFTGTNGVPHHYWDFGDGTGTSTLQNPSYTFTDTGNYTIMYVAIDSSTCNIADTVYLSVVILQSQQFSAVFNIPPFDPCTQDSLIVNLQFTGSGADSLVWNMGDGTFYYDINTVTHAFTNPGTYTLSLTAYNTQCNQVATTDTTIIYNPTMVMANANAAPNVLACDPPFNVNFTGGNTPQHYWDFGDGTGTSTLQNPTYTFTDTGVYNVMYIAIDSSTCNISDTVFLNVTILQSQAFSASFSPIPPQPCSDTVFVNIAFTGTGADSLVWDMGNGDVYIDVQNINYAYTIPGIYTLTLTAYDFTCGRVGTISQTIVVEESLMQGTVEIPNVFSPNNGDDKNPYFVAFYKNMPAYDIIPDMEYYHAEIYNRWGLKLWESSSGNEKWDGKIDGKNASEGVYYYIVKYQRKCWDSEIFTKTGHVTIIR